MISYRVLNKRFSDPVLLIHGLLGSEGFWLKYLKYFSKKKVILVNLNYENIILDYKKTVSGGDHNASRMYLLNIQKLFSSDVIKAYKNEQQAS